MPVDFLIVGQGLAGSLLAWTLIQQHYKVLVIDNGEENASKIAAGLINPITGQRLVKTANLEHFLTTAKLYYQQLSATFSQSFLVELPMLRILQNQREYETAQRRLQEPDYQGFISQILTDLTPYHAPYGILLQQQTAYLRTRLLLDNLRDYFQQRGSYQKIKFNYQDITLTPKLRWQAIEPKTIIFCEGYLAQQNPWFNKLPFQLAKGEILSCETTDFCPEQMLNFRHWLIPLDQHRFKTGATFDPKQLNLERSENARLNLLSSLQSTCPHLYSINVYEHKVGIRPTTLDKQPFIGWHPNYPNLYIFNGFGAKGSLFIPWHAKHLLEHFHQNIPLAKHCQINRYDKSFITA